MSHTRSPRDSGIGINENFAPPHGPPPPIMPEGWIARFDERYQRFYYVNTYTKQSQWEKPPGTIDPPAPSRSPNDYDRPPAYNESISHKGRQLPQKYNSLIPQQPQQQPQQQQNNLQPPQPQASISGSISPSRGISGRLSSFLKSRVAKSPQPQQQQQYYYQQQQRPIYYGGGRSMMGEQRRLGMGAGGVAALGVGGGLLGGMLLADAIDDYQYDQGFQDGQDYGDQDYGGGDFGGGDMDFDGGDF